MRPTLRLSLLVAALSLALVALASACGGSDGPETVNGCEIQAGRRARASISPDADLEGADLSGADLSGATLDGTNLSDANLSEANLTDAQISDADLSDADLTGATLEGAVLSGTNLDGATLCGTIRTDGTTDDSSCPASSDTTDTTVTHRHRHDRRAGRGGHVVHGRRPRLPVGQRRRLGGRLVGDRGRDGRPARGRRHGGAERRPERIRRPRRPVRRSGARGLRRAAQRRRGGEADSETVSSG